LLQKSGKAIKKTIESDQHVRSPIDKDVAPVYVETTEGFVKTYETVRVETTDNASSASNQGSEVTLGEPSPNQAHGSRRLTEQTERLYDDTRPTSTTGPSFGHFGRPFSHQIDPIEHIIQASAAFDAFPVDPARVVFMQRTVGAQPGFGIPISALGELGIGFGAFSPFGDSLLHEDVYADDASVKRSAYVETVSDEDVGSSTKVPQNSDSKFAQ
jgi:hypothetical protein